LATTFGGKRLPAINRMNIPWWWI